MLLCAVLAGGAIALGGCGDTADAGPKGGPSLAGAAASAAPVALHLDAGDYSLASSTTTIRGTAARGSKVTVNGHRASLHGGHWSGTLHLHLGQNRVTIEATLKGHPATRKTITVTREKTSAEIEAETRVHETEAEEQQGTAPQPTTTAAPSPEEACTNGTYVNSAGNTVCRPEESPSAPAGATAECTDGTYSFSQSRSGTCSHHGGVARWL
jgi:resuscitation-promoting factor RpfB